MSVTERSGSLIVAISFSFPESYQHVLMHFELILDSYRA